MFNISVIAPLSIIGSFIVVSILIPKISWIVHRRNLIDIPDHRSSHKGSTPTMAGVSFFLALIFALIFMKSWDTDVIGINLIAALALMFALGLKDDLVVSTPKAKLGGELLAILFILFCNCFQVSSLEGFLGIHNIPTVISYVLIILMLLTIINSYNMIDGIDGLAAIMGIVIFTVYGLIFYFAGLTFYFLVCLCLMGILLAYLRFNLSSSKKIFMGDTGSLVIGFCIGFLSLKFFSMDSSLLAEYSFNGANKFFIIAGIFYIPLFDTFRVIGVRLLNKKSPFSPDNNHIHHILINSGLSHFKASFFLGFLNFMIAVFIISLSSQFNSFQMFGVLIVSFIIFLGIFHKLKNNVRSENRFKHLVRAIHFLF